ncbi:hypothetical protein ACFYO1_12545 [Nocardia sp. NPDC006044]|uniref:hypothetical protein n=1 Tax=Nocardia sp. NPDC006044 TaxID=3364306 RepID=UPI003696E58B
MNGGTPVSGSSLSVVPGKVREVGKYVHEGGTQIMSALTDMAEKLGITADTFKARDEWNAAMLTTSSLDLS